MTDTSNVIIAALVSATAYAGCANAATDDKKINIIRVDAVYSDTQRYELETTPQAAMKAAQMTVARDPDLRIALLAQGAELNNVVRLQTLPDGTSLVYLR